MAEAVDAEFPEMFCHRKRVEWGVGVLSGEQDGKRRYLFEDGEERIMAAGHYDLMQKVERPDRDQQATYARLAALIAKREGREPAGVQALKTLIAQLERFTREYPAGFSGDKWKGLERNLRVRRAREGQHGVSNGSLEGLAKSNRLEAVWNQVVALINESGLAPDKLESISNAEHQRVLGEAVRELLRGTDHYERRFDRFVMRYESVFRKFPSWQVATALPALVSPVEHVCVEPAAFRSQLKALARPSTLAARPSGSAYTRCVNMARGLASALGSQGQVPMDLLEVCAFVRTMAELSRRARS